MGVSASDVYSADDCYLDLVDGANVINIPGPSFDGSSHDGYISFNCDVLSGNVSSVNVMKTSSTGSFSNTFTDLSSVYYSMSRLTDSTVRLTFNSVGKSTIYLKNIKFYDTSTKVVYPVVIPNAYYSSLTHDLQSFYGYLSGGINLGTILSVIGVVLGASVLIFVCYWAIRKVIRVVINVFRNNKMTV